MTKWEQQKRLLERNLEHVKARIALDPNSVNRHVRACVERLETVKSSEKLFINGWSPKDAEDCLRQAGLHMEDLKRLTSNGRDSVVESVKTVLTCLGAAIELQMRDGVSEPEYSGPEDASYPGYTTKDAYRNGYRHGMGRALNLLSDYTAPEEIVYRNQELVITMLEKAIMADLKTWALRV